MNCQKPTCYMIAGPNGAGKTTYALRYLPHIAACRKFLNADEIAKGLSPLDYNSGLQQASRIFLEKLAQLIAEKETFAFETTLSGRHYLSRIKEWQSCGWRVVMFYLYIPSPEFSACRVQQRVQQGGHDIPPPDIVRRYPRSIKNLFEYMTVCDLTYCLDNSVPEPRPIFEYSKGKPMEITDFRLYSAMQEIADHV